MVWGLIFYAAFRYRRRSEADIPVQTRYNLPIEIFYTIAPVMMVIVFFYFTVDTQNKVLHTTTNPDQNVTVVGQQWSWTFNYNLEALRQGQGDYVERRRRRGRLRGRHHRRPADAVAGQGQERHVLPRLARRDPLVLGPRRSCSRWTSSPAATTHFTLTPTRSGTFEGRCAELCGVYHSRMLFNVKVVDQAAYDAHLEELADRGNTGPALGASQTSRDARPGRPMKALEEKSDCRLRRPVGRTRRTAATHGWARSSSASSPPPTTS